jgi:hypothetical protein
MPRKRGAARAPAERTPAPASTGALPKVSLAYEVPPPGRPPLLLLLVVGAVLWVEAVPPLLFYAKHGLNPGMRDLSDLAANTAVEATDGTATGQRSVFEILEPHDERFVWRMFSAPRLLRRCDVHFGTEPFRRLSEAELRAEEEKTGGRARPEFRRTDWRSQAPISAQRSLSLQQSWMDLMSFCRPSVIQAVSQKLCELAGVHGKSIFRHVVVYDTFGGNPGVPVEAGSASACAGLVTNSSR